MSENETSARNAEGEQLLFGLDFNSLKEQTIDFGNNNASAGSSQSHKDESGNCNSHVPPPVLIASPSHVSLLEHTVQLLLSKSIDFTNNSPPAQDQDFQLLFEWAELTRGAVLDSIKCGRDEHGGRGLFTTKHVYKGGILAMLPRSLRLGQKLACQRIPSLPLNTPDLSALALLLLDFVDDPEWDLYVKTLPRRDHEFTNAILMNDNAVQRWKSHGDEYQTAIDQVRARGDACVSYIRDNLANSSSTGMIQDESAIRWAIAMILSRSHAFGTTRGRWITPIFDLANHSEDDASARLETDDQGGLLLVACKTLACGDEVTLDYQERTDANLVATYGFSLVHS